MYEPHTYGPVHMDPSAWSLCIHMDPTHMDPIRAEPTHISPTRTDATPVTSPH
jgi:hypothetical protein